LKQWNRAKRLALIETMNPTLIDLAEYWYQALPQKMQIPRSARNDKIQGDDANEE
jgi:hypothetical protein